MTCKCRDTNAKRCRWEFSTPDPDMSAYMTPLRAMRRPARKEYERMLEAEDSLPEPSPLVWDTPFNADEHLAENAESDADDEAFSPDPLLDEAYAWLDAFNAFEFSQDSGSLALGYASEVTLDEINEIGGFSVTRSTYLWSS